jgi:peroxiredoxin
MRFYEGSTIEAFQVRTVRETEIRIPLLGSRWTHLQFRRFAGCPICNLHLRTMARRREDMTAAGIHEIVVFHSKAETMKPFQGDLPFDVVADPDKVLYRRFGVGQSLRSVGDVRAMWAYVKGVLAPHPASSVRGEGGHLGLPADFLFAPDGRIAACKYGVHANDQWSVDDLLELVRRRGDTSSGVAVRA